MQGKIFFTIFYHKAIFCTFGAGSFIIRMVNMCRRQGIQQCKLVLRFLCKFYISTVYTSFKDKKRLSLDYRIKIN